ncbi:hypothetical protein JBO49_16270 [Serratia fonticola]|uniref:hypothetical protein n=1 Tax=Serratia fonticola TaxID=47917 RepID=UPI00192B13D9|nr:hypothetical protein [Serratia fonticola]MBL5862161.1 hypothetical protein [Serratia fonticola]
MENGVQIIECLDDDDPGSEGKCLWHILKLMKIEVKYLHVESINELLEAIISSKYKYIHISAHGCISKEKKFKGWWTKNGIGSKRKVAKYRGRVTAIAIISTACKSGTESFGNYVVNELGAQYFIGPTGSPKFYNASLFAHIFYHKLFKTKHGVRKAFNSYKKIYKNPHNFSLYAKNTKTTTSR